MLFVRRIATLVPLLMLVLVGAAPADARSYTDPALQTVLDGVSPTALPAPVSVAVVPSVVDQLVVSNPTPTVLEVVGTDGRPFLRISSAGVLADLSSRDWYLTGTPEGGLVPAGAGGAPRWARVSRGTTWAEFDPRLHPAVTPTAMQRRAGRDAVLATWAVPLRYGGKGYTAGGHVLFSPVRGGFTVAVTKVPAGLTATALQGELPGLFVRAEQPTTVLGRDGRPFLTYDGTRWTADTSSPSWVDVSRARGQGVPTGGASTVVARGSSYSWLDARLRYPHDLPPQQDLARTTVVQRWSVPVTVAGRAAALEGTVTWVPRTTALAAVTPSTTAHGHGRTRALAGLAAAAVLSGATVLARRARGRSAQS